jgi:hypothetical protein
MQNWQQTLAPQYQNSPVITTLLADWNAILDPQANIAAFVADTMNINTATGEGLDVLGAVVGLTNGRNLEVTGYGNYALSDSAFRLLVQAKAAANIANCTCQEINAILMNLFPGLGDCYVIDNQNMTMTLQLGFSPNAVQTAIINELISFVRPAGVLLTGPTPTYGTLTISIQTGAGYNTSGPATFFTFPSNTATVGGGSGSFNYQWAYTYGAGQTWADSGTTTASIVLSTSGVGAGATSTASLTCTVTDTITGDTATSSAAAYSFQDTSVATLSVSIGAGATATGASAAHTFGTNTATVTGGSGSFIYDWIINSSSGGTWITANGASQITTPSVSGVGSGVVASASIVCRVTDSVTGLIATSAPATYSFQNTSVVVVISGSIYAASTINPNYTFPPISAVATGGSGSFTYAWSFVYLDTPSGSWALVATGASCQVSCTHEARGSTTQINVTCTITDTVTMQTYTSNTILFSYEYQDASA